ncbi:MAG: glycosyltransferase [Planctomycetes bacterium]|nr:glycosyltransferase [Planctomycetota bacterium]
MRIVHIVTQLEVGGAQWVAMRLADGLRRRGHDVQTWFLYRKRECYRDEPHLRVVRPRRPRTPLGAVLLVGRLGCLLREHRPDAAIGFTHYANALGLLAAARAGVPVRLATHHNPAWSFPRLGRRLDAAVGRTDVYQQIVAVSQAVADSFAGHDPRYRSKLTVIPNGLATLAPAADRLATRQRHALDAGRPLLLCVGRLVGQKNHRTALDALARLPEAQLALVGDGELRPMLQAQCRRLGLEGRVRFLGQRTRQEVADLLAAADAFVMPSLHEGMSIALIEALAAGVPVVSSDIPAQADLLACDGGRAGLLVEAADAAALAGAIRRLLGDAELRARCAAMGRRRAAQFGDEGMVDAYEQRLLMLRDAARTARAGRPCLQG